LNFGDLLIASSNASIPVAESVAGRFYYVKPGCKAVFDEIQEIYQANIKTLRPQSTVLYFKVNILVGKLDTGSRPWKLLFDVTSIGGQ
jgi:hypothetical protein